MLSLREALKTLRPLCQQEVLLDLIGPGVIDVAKRQVQAVCKTPNLKGHLDIMNQGVGQLLSTMLETRGVTDPEAKDLISQNICDILLLEKPNHKWDLEPPSKDKEWLELNFHFWLDHTKRRGMDPMGLRWYEGEALPAQEENFEALEKLLSRFIPNFSKLASQFLEAICQHDIEEKLARGESVVIVTNHDSWSTQIIPAVLAVRQLAAHTTKDNHILLGPALMTFSQIFDTQRLGQACGNLICTVPDTPNAQAPEFKDNKVVQGLGAQSTRELFRLAKPQTEGRGQLIFMAPSGTSDKKQEDGCLDLVPPSDKVCKLIQKLRNKGAHIWPIGFHQGDLYSNGSKMPQPSKVQMHTGRLIGQEDEISLDEIMKQLAQLVRDEEGHQLGVYAAPERGE